MGVINDNLFKNDNVCTIIRLISNNIQFKNNLHI